MSLPEGMGFKFTVHPARVLRPGSIPEKVAANQKDVNQSDIPLRNNELKQMKINHPKGVKPKIRER